MFKNPFKRRSSMTNEQHEQAQDIQNEQTAAQHEQAQTDAEQVNDVSVEDLQAQIVKLEESLKYEKAVAANAKYEAEKSKERLEREADTAKKFALEKFSKDLLDSVDNLERAIQAAGDEESPVLEGVKLTLKSLLSTLEKFEIVAVDTDNGFNADWHQAVGMTQLLKQVRSAMYCKKAIPFQVVYSALQWLWSVNKVKK